MPEPQTPPKPPVIKPNAAGVVEFAGYLNSIGQDGNAVLRKFNKEAKAGTATRLVDPLQKLADSYKWQGNLFSGDSVAVPVVTNQPAKAAQAPAPVSQETNTLAEVGKSSWNGLLDVVTGAARTPQILHSVAGTILDATGYTQSEEEKKDSEAWSGRLQGLAEAASGFMSNFKATVDASGQYDRQLIEKDEQGNYKWNGLSGAAHMIGNSLGFLGSMALGGTVTKGARLLQGTATALKVAKAAGNVAEVAAITDRMQKTDRAVRYVTGMMSQLEPTYQEAYRSMQDPDKAALFAAVVTPVVAAVDAFTGGEAAVFGGRKLLAGKVAKEVLKEMAGKELTQESFGVAAKKVAQSYLKEVVKGGAKVGAEEMGTEVIQEGYTAMMESIFDKDADSKDFSSNDMPLDARLLNAGMLGGMLGHVTGTTMQAFQQIGAYEPLAFRSLHQAYKEGGATALEDQGATLSSSLDKMVRSGEMTEAGAAQVSEQLSRMKNIISSAKNPYTASPESQFQLYDVYYNHAPAQAEILTDLTDRVSALQGEAPVRFQSAEDGSIVRNELGEPQVEAYIDPAVAESERVGLEKDLINQNQRVEYIKSVQAQLINTGNSINYVKGLSVIGRFDEGDTVVATGLDRKKVSGRVVSVSNTGQELTLAIAPDEEGNPQQITVKAIETKPDSPAVSPVVSVPVDAALADGFTPHETISAANRPYQEGDFIVLKENPSDPVEVVSSQLNDKGEMVLTVADESGVRDVVVNGSDPDVLGLYDPNKALQAAEARQQQKVAETKRKQLEAKIDPAIVKAVKLMSPRAIAQRWLSFEGVAGKETERSYLEMVAADKGVNVKAPVSELTDTAPTITGNQDEVIDDAVWEQIGVTGIVPDAIVNDIAGRSLEGTALTERQSIIQEDPDELVRIGAIMDSIAIELLQADETILEGTTTEGGTTNAPDQTGNQQPADGSTAPGQSTTIPEFIQPVFGNVADGTGQPANGASPNSSPTGKVTQSGTPAGTNSSTSVAEVLSDAERDRLISGRVTGSEYDSTLFNRWPEEVAMGTPLSPNQQAVVDAAMASDRARFKEQVEYQRKKLNIQQPSGSPEASVGQDVIATLNSGTQTVGKVISFEDGDAWVEHLDRKGKKTTMSRIGPGNLVDKATKTALDIPKQQRASSLAELSKEALGKLVTKLRQNFPRIQVSLLSDAEMRTMFNISEDQQLYGAVRDGVVYLNADKAKADTPIHEFAHLYAETLKKHYPQFYQRGLSLVRGSNYESQVRVNYPELTSEEAILEEALVQAIGEKGASLATPSKARQFMQWLKNILAKLGEAIGIELTPETTLDAFIEARAKELLSGNTLAEITGEQEGTRLAKVVLPPLTTPVPAVMDEATLASYSLDEKQKAELAKKSVIWDEATDSYTREAVDQVAEGNEIASNIAKLRASGQAIKAIVGRANVLDVANIGRVLFGDSAFGQQWQGMLESGRRRVAPMKVSGHDFIAASFETLKGKTIYRGVSSLDSVTKWNVDVEVDGIDQQISLTPDVAISLAAQYKSMMADYGHFDPDHRDKVKAGVEPQLEAEILNPADPTKELVVKLNKQQLDDLYDLVFHNDPEIADLLDRWVSHSDGIFDKVARVFTLMQGGQLGKANWYYPISSASTEAQLNQRDIQRFVDDASQLRTRQGAPKRIRAYGFLSDVSRYQRDAENYVQLSPIWQNIDKLLARQSGTFINADMKSVKSALETLRDSFATPEASRNNRNFSAAFDWDFGKLMRLATLSRFAFNLAIPIKQITGYFSAFGNGVIDNKYLTAELANYGKMIGESYWLIGRGSEEGNYSGGATSFDEGVAELRSIDDPNAQALLWRLLGSGNPDIQFDDWSKIKDLAAGREMFAGKMRAFFEEYGLNVTHRADVAVVLSLYNAAKAQVVETQPSMPADEQQKEAARLAKEALYYSNSTYDKTDRTPLQLSANLITQMLLLYKSHNMKIYNTLARRSIEYGQADAAGKPAAKAALAGNMALNMVLAQVITTLIDYGVKNLRDLTKDEKDKKELTPEETAKQLVFNLFAQIAQVAPAELGDAGGYIFSKWANPQSPRELLDIGPFGTVVDLMESALRTAATYGNTEYNSKEQFEENRTRALQQLLRATATTFGIPMEAVRQANNGIATMLLPEKKESRSRGRGRGEQDGALGIEFELGLQERTGRGR